MSNMFFYNDNHDYEIGPAAQDRSHEPPRRRTAVTRRGGLCGRSYACHRLNHLFCPHRCSGGRRRTHSCTAFAVATFQPLPLCLALTVGRLRRCADSVCDALTRQGTIQMMQPSARPVYPRPHRTTPRNCAAPAHAVPFPLPAVPKRL